VRDVREALMVARKTDGKLVRRPLSPHIQIYRWPISMVLSILHRASGCALGAGTLMMTWWLVAAAESDNSFTHAQSFMGSILGRLMLFGWSAALFYHLCSGLRHLWMDTGRGFEKAQYDLSAWMVLGATALLTVGIWIVALAVG
jgi:succinate dehydrogenase / fumarate reductase cytochrome b subunit